MKKSLSGYRWHLSQLLKKDVSSQALEECMVDCSGHQQAAGFSPAILLVLLLRQSVIKEPGP